MNWYAGRSVYLWGQKSDGTNVFEERVVAFAAQSESDAEIKARAEAEAYCHSRRDVTYERHPELILYLLDDVALADGAEVWSEMFEARESLVQFYATRYLRYEYHPE
ncbi:hypothetical protein [Nevskia soli]|uniref:hypothetical protein n=1 Tax=Nevskia soli TaxID=418856 RepID=UPI0012F7C6AD|nr:hypothetical protein [Nevskia soli]